MYTTIKNQQVYFQKVGLGKDLVLLHGWGTDVSSFWPSIEVLKNHFTIWLIDLPGMGRSQPPKKSWTISDYARLVEEFILQQKIKKPILFRNRLFNTISNVSRIISSTRVSSSP